MFSIFKPKKSIKVNFSDFLQQDMHAHILPGIDDGSPDVETSISLIRGMQDAGIKHLFGTPHIMADMHRNNRQTITAAYDLLKAKLQESGMEVNVNFAAEYMLDEGFSEHLNAGKLLTIFDYYVLIETRFYQEPLDILDILFHLDAAGHKGILAHPERYHYIDDNLKVLEKYVDRGFPLQLNVLSLSGYYGVREKEVANKILDAGLYDFIGTDLHHERHLDRIASMELDAKVIKKIEQTDWQNYKISEFYQHN